MSSLRWPSFNLGSQARFAFIFVVVVGYFVGLNTTPYDLGPLEIAITATLTLVYLYLGLRDEEFFALYPSGLGKAAFFIIALGLSLSVQLLLGPGGSGLISLPTAGTAVERLAAPGRWAVYLLLLAGMAVPVGINFGWGQAFSFTLTFAPAIFFVVVFTKVTLAEQEARRQAEQLAAQLEQANRELAAYATQAEALATAKERNRLAREIHDNLGHYLTVVNVQTKAAQAVLEQDPARAQDALQKAQKLTEEGLGAIRQSIAALRESPLGDRPLTEAVEKLLVETEQSGLVAQLDVRGTPRRLDARAELTLYRAVQEGLTNVRKHARASRVDVVLDFTAANRVMVQVRDNGVGARHISGTGNGDEEAASGFGLLGVRERAQLLGGEVHVTSAPGAGFSLQLEIPG